MNTRLFTITITRVPDHVSYHYRINALDERTHQVRTFPARVGSHDNLLADLRTMSSLVAAVIEHPPTSTV